jgi:hypothetical protein
MQVLNLDPWTYYIQSTSLIHTFPSLFWEIFERLGFDGGSMCIHGGDHGFSLVCFGVRSKEK